MEELKNCPFCGGEAKLLKGLCELDNYVMCLECRCKTKLHNTKESAIKAWNTRKPLERVIERLEEVSFLDIDEAYADDGQRMVFMHEAIEIIKEEMM